MAEIRGFNKVVLASLAFLLIVSCSLISPTQPTSEPTEPAAATDTPAPPATESAQDTPAPVATATQIPAVDLGPATKPVFAVFEENEPDAVPALPAMAVEPSLTNVMVPFALSDEQVARLEKDGFVVTPGTEKEFFTLYEKARYGNVPVFVTTDSLLHVYHLLFDKVLRTAEMTYFIPLLHDLNQAMLEQTDAAYQSLRDTSWEEAAKRTVAFISVGGRLLDADFEIPEYAQELAEAELVNVERAAGMASSPIFPGLKYGEDYTQYIPRGHYTLSEELTAYFKSMMWYGRMTFRLVSQDPEIGRAETRSALILTHALYNASAGGRPALELWEDLYSPTVFFVGRSDDLTALQYAKVMDAVYGEDVRVTELVDEEKLDTFITTASQLPPPEILGIIIMDTDDEEEATKGLRFMGQRFVPDAYIFRQLIYRNVGTRDHRRGLPKGLDIFAAMGSDRAYELLDEMEETSYANYPSQMAEVQAWLDTLTVEDWTETLYNTWLYTFHPLLDVPGEGYPAFMQSPAWLDKQLNTALGSWAELKHDTILYAKQVYAELGGGPPPPPPLPPRGYVEPVPHFYARLSALTAMTREGLASRELLTERDAESLQKLEGLVDDLQTMAEKELRGEPLTEEEYTTIRFYGGTLEELTMAASESEDSASGGNLFMMDEEPQAAVIADVATDPQSPTGHVVLEEAVGRINELHAVVPLIEEDGTISLQVVKGGVFSYYEFVWPADDRLTDEVWREMLDEGTAPDPPAWTGSFFTASGANDALQIAVLSFQKSVTSAYWMQRDEFRDDEPALEQFGAEIRQLRSADRYVGHQLVSTDFRSYDQQSPELAVVTVREAWQDTLYAYEGSPTYDDQVVATRGPYTVDVTYTLTYETHEYGSTWRVTRAVYADKPPAW